MNAIPDAWGSPAHHLLHTATTQAEDHHAAYERSGRVEHLEHAIAVFEQVLALARNVDLRSAAANGLGISLWSRYERTGAAADLDQAVGLFREALALYPAEETPAHPAFRANLAGVLRLRWRRTGDPEDLAESTALVRRSLAATSPGNPARTGRLNNLADALIAHHLEHDDSSALAEAVDVYREALASAPEGDVLAATRANLAEALRLRYRSTRDVALLDEAAERARAALVATPRGHPLRARFQSNLALVLLNRYQAADRPVDLAEADELIEAAVRDTPAGHPNRAERLFTRSGIRRLELMRVSGLRDVDPRRAGADVRTGRSRAERAALNGAIRAAREAVAAVPRGHVLRSGAVLGLAAALGFKAVVERDAAAGAESVAGYREVAEDPVAPAHARVAAGWRWATTALAGGADWAEVAAPFELAVDLLPRLAPDKVTRADRERQLAAVTGLARDAAACAIARRDPAHALRLLEHGRGVLLGRALDPRAAPPGLDPDLARRFEELRSALDRPEDVNFTPAPGPALSGEDRHALAEEWDRLLEAIRRQPGFERFLRPPEAADLVAAVADRGPVVVVNVSGLRCDALLLTGGRVVAAPLPLLNLADTARRADAFHSAAVRVGHPFLPPDVQEEARRTIDETLDWLWHAVAEPVLDTLGPLPPDTRLWWVPTGPLVRLPLHAAGRRDSPDDHVPDRVIPSYAPTVRSLIDPPTARDSTDPPVARSPADPPTTRTPAADLPTAQSLADPPIARSPADLPTARPPAAGPVPLVVAMPTTPGYSNLPGVRDEAAAVARLFPRTKVLTDTEAVRAAVLDALPRHDVVHFACHAVSAADGTEAGHLVLADHATHPLTVADIARLRLDDAELAYLSACATNIAHEDLDDEALHIAGACRMAGFRHVVGTLWEVRDQVAMTLATDFYTALAAGADPASALHAAVRGVRAANPSSPELWASHVHVGP
ncbi:CHAT domain-containing protein [Saccharothrix sp. HUAS TT1]|uniref:CHAT domain-containing protein n=1 Tax=unclassified Saccharothrix TaxID=2593673 RepID=UPI00345C062E